MNIPPNRPVSIAALALLFVCAVFKANHNQSTNDENAKQLGENGRVQYFKTRSRDLQENNCTVFAETSGVSFQFVARHSGKILAIDNDSVDEGATIVQMPAGDSVASDLWFLKPVGNGHYHVVNRHSGLPMAVFGGSMELRADIIQSLTAWHLSDNWCFQETDDSHFKIVNQNSGYLIDVAGGSSVDGVNVLQWRDSGAAHQEFDMISVPYESPTSAPTETSAPSPGPTSDPTVAPTTTPSVGPTETGAPSPSPSLSPSASLGPSPVPTETTAPSPSPSSMPSASDSPSPGPTETSAPSPGPTNNPTASPSGASSNSPSASPSVNATSSPSAGSTVAPISTTSAPSAASSSTATSPPTAYPSASPSDALGSNETDYPSPSPTESPAPSPSPSAGPTSLPTAGPSILQPVAPSASRQPSSEPSNVPSVATSSPSVSNSPSVDLNCVILDTTEPYHIVARHSGLSLAVEGLSTESGAPIVQLMTDYFGNADDWFLEAIGDTGFYHISNSKSGLAIAVADNSLDTGSAVVQLPADSTLANDNWCFQETGDGFYQIVAQSSGHLIDIVAASENEGVNVHQWKETGATNQQFTLVPVATAPTATPTTSTSPSVSAVPTGVPKLTFVNANSVTMKENRNFVVQVKAEYNTPTTLPITYSISGGIDASLFAINPDTGDLFFETIPDFESPMGGANSSNFYQVDVTASLQDGLTEQQSISATVTNVAPQCADGPLPVFLLIGQSNMVGLASLVHLEELVFKSPELLGKYGHLGNQTAYDWTERSDVYIKWTKEAAQEGKLRAGLGAALGAHFGPELEMGFVLGDNFCECQKPIFLLKAADGGRDLAIDWRPPLSGEGDYETNPGYPFGWYYDIAMADVKATLQDDELSRLIPSYSPEAGYELVGAAWFHGWADMLRDQSVAEYEFNLVNLIKSVRLELNAPDLPFVVGEMGMHGVDTTNNRVLAVREAQRRAAESFNGTAVYVPTAQYVVSDQKVYDNEIHYYGRADTIFDVGHAFGEAMLGLLDRSEEDYCQQV